MKKLLCIFASIGLILGTSTSLSSCNSNKKKEDNNNEKNENDNQNNESLIGDFKKEIESIFNKHNNYLVNECNILHELKEGSIFNFINKKNIEKYSEQILDKLSPTDKQQFEKDVKEILKIDKLKKEINDLKNNKKFDSILKNINEIFNRINILYDQPSFIYLEEKEDNDFEIGKIKISYSISYKYKNVSLKEEKLTKKNLEFRYQNDYKIWRIIESFRIDINEKFILSGKSYVNWEDIKGNKEDYESFGISSITQFKTKNLEKYKNRLLNFINESKIFFKGFNSFEVIGDNVEFSYKHLFANFINFFENKESKDFEQIEDYNKSKKMFETIFSFRKKTNEDENYIKNLKELYFNQTNFKIWNEEFLKLKCNTVKKNWKFSEEEAVINKLKKLDCYKYADSVGRIYVDKLKIRFKKNGHEYLYAIPSFNLCVLYNTINVKNENEISIYNKKSELLSKFSLYYLIKKFQDELGISNYSCCNDDKLKILFYLNRKYSEILRKNKFYYESLSNLSNLFNLINNNFFSNSKENLFIDCIGNGQDLIENFRDFFAIRENSNKDSSDDFLNFKGYQLSTNTFYKSRVKCILSKDNFKITIKSNNNNIGLPNHISFKLGYLALNINCPSIFEVENDFIYLS